MGLKAVFFDLDGTLIDSFPDMVQTINLLRQERGLRIFDAGAIRPNVGRGPQHLVRNCIPELPAAELDEATRRYMDIYMSLERPLTRLYPGVHETLAALRQRGLKLGIVTNKAIRSSQAALAKFLSDVPFASIVTREQVPNPKPHPDHLLRAIDLAGVQASQAIYVGDDPIDKTCAAAAGVTFYGAAYGIGGVKVLASHRLNSIGDLLLRLGL
ncbi:MAG: HAD family hydrolase [Bdellovibrionales bacterium]|nr:HAD family hydrolase [Bdellovibrionales bacterium]